MQSRNIIVRSALEEKMMRSLGSVDACKLVLDEKTNSLQKLTQDEIALEVVIIIFINACKKA